MTTTTNTDRCPICDVPTDGLLCWCCCFGTTSRHQFTNDDDTPTTSTKCPPIAKSATSFRRPARTVAELLTRPHARHGIQQLLTHHGTDAHAAAAALLHAYTHEISTRAARETR